LARVTIHLEKGESEEEVQEMLIKAFQHHSAGAEHKEAFHDPAARDVFNKMINEYDKMWAEMLKEIGEVLDGEV
jgi:uncharacterized membrane protein YqiK